MRVRVMASQLYLSVAPLSVAGCGRLQLGVAQWATSVALLQKLIIKPKNGGSRFSSVGLQALEDLTFYKKIVAFNFSHPHQHLNTWDISSPEA